MRHFLQYWKAYNSETELGTPLDFAASAQFKKLKPGDTLWIVALREGRPTLLRRLLVTARQVLTSESLCLQVGSLAAGDLNSSII